MTYKIEGMTELVNTIKTLEILPQKCVNTAARKGILIAKPTAKNGGWLDQTGEMRRGIIHKAEKTKIKGKKVYNLMMNPKKSDIFVPKRGDGKPRYYYPASQEYGFKTRNGGYVPGFNYLKRSIVDNSTKIERTIVDVLSKEIDKLK